MLPDRCHVLMNYVFRLAKAQVPLPYVLFAKKGSSEGRRHIHTFLILLPFSLQAMSALSVCVCVCLYIHILTHTDRRLCVCVCVYINQYICPAFPPCMDLRPFPLISCSTHWGITAQMEKLVNLFCSLFFADSVLIPYGATVRIILLDRLLYII